MHLTVLKVSRTCPMRPSQTIHDRCSGSKPPSFPGQRCWSWSGCWVSCLVTHVVRTHCGGVLQRVQPIKMSIDVCCCSCCQGRFSIMRRKNLDMAQMGVRAKQFLYKFTFESVWINLRIKRVRGNVSTKVWRVCGLDANWINAIPLIIPTKWMKACVLTIQQFILFFIFQRSYSSFLVGCDTGQTVKQLLCSVLMKNWLELGGWPERWCWENIEERKGNGRKMGAVEEDSGK